MNPCVDPQLQPLDQGANIGDIHDQRSGASTARDQIGTLRGIKSECLRAIVGIRNLRGANANIGAARAAFFPSISLTGNYGFASSTLSSLISNTNRSWSFGGTVDLPLFDWGRRKSELKLSRAQADELVAKYQRTVQGAFQEVADGLVGRQRYAEAITAQSRTLEAQRRLARTARLRYDNGIAIYLEVLDAERNLFSAGQQLVQLRANELQNSVNLYVALGGGSKTEDARAVSE